MTFCNELYIRTRFFVSKPKTSPGHYYAPFKAGGIEYTIRTVGADYVNTLYDFFRRSVDTQSSEFAMPHHADIRTLASIFKKRSYIPLGIFCEDIFIGYALIRLLFPNAASYAIFVAKERQGRGIGTAALAKELELINLLGFRPYSAVSKNNAKSLKMLKKLNIEFGSDLDEYYMVKDKR